MTDFTSRLVELVQRQNQFQCLLGRGVAWLCLVLVILSASIVILRYGFDSGSIALQESILYVHATLFMLGFAYTLQQGQHVRVDVFYSNQCPRRKAMIDLAGSLLFALPTMVFIFWVSWDYVSASWAIKEGSAEAGGLAYLYLLKTVILVMAVLMISQTLSFALQSALQVFQAQHPKVIACLPDVPVKHEEKL